MGSRINTPAVMIFQMALCASIAFSPGCWEKSSSPSPDQAKAINQSLTAWFRCIECTNGELDTVTRYADTVVPLLVSTLREGASPASREEMRRRLGSRSDELAASNQGLPTPLPLPTRDEFIAGYLSNWDAQHRIRAAVALGAIGGQPAEAALQEALMKADRDDVRLAIQGALDQIQHPRDQR